MKLFIILQLFLFSLPLSSPDSEMQVKDNCTFNGKKLYGRVQFVQAHANLTVQIVNSFPDLDVRFVNTQPTQCGEWQLVNSHPDFTVKTVTSHANIKIRINR